MSIKENYDYVKNKVKEAAIKSGRKLEDITILGVTKTIDTDRINELIALGIKDIGENKVQELLEKYPEIDQNINWHIIGHLQTNKIKYIIEKSYLIHSVDSIKLAKEIDRLANQNGVIVDVLIQINIGNEDSKFGIKSEDAYDFVKSLLDFKNIRIRGLMTIAPFVEEAENNREHFRNMRKLFIDINNNFNDNICMDILSMGMSIDYQVAIEEGSTLVRIGQGLFGRRTYN